MQSAFHRAFLNFIVTGQTLFAKATAVINWHLRQPTAHHLLAMHCSNFLNCQLNSDIRSTLTVMRFCPKLFLSLLCSILSLSLVAQQQTNVPFSQHIPNNSRPFASQRKSAYNRRILPSWILKNPQALAAFIQKYKDSLNTVGFRPPLYKYMTNGTQPLSPACIDSSFLKLIATNNNSVNVFSITHTSDDGILITGSITNNQNPTFRYGWKVNGVVIKTDNKGNIKWTKMFADQVNNELYEVDR